MVSYGWGRGRGEGGGGGWIGFHVKKMGTKNGYFS